MPPLETELEMVQRHVRDGARLVARQQQNVLQLSRSGLPVEEAKHLLALFQKIQAKHLAHLERLSRERNP